MKVALDITTSRNVIIGTGNDGLRFPRLPWIVKTGFGCEKFGAEIDAFWRRIFDDLGEFPPEVWQLSSRANLTTLSPIPLQLPWGETTPPRLHRKYSAMPSCSQDHAEAATVA